MRRLRDQLTLRGRARYLLWRTGLFGENATVQLSTGDRIVLSRSSLFELETAYEIFVSDVYRCPRSLDPASIRRIIDVGSNVGYTLVYWCRRRFPMATIEAFEPHPRHFAVLQQTVELNGLGSRIRLHPVAAGTAAKLSMLVDADTASTLNARTRADPHLNSIQVRIVDFFEAVRGARIDLLKLDCEGGEYDILMDARFPLLDIGNIVLEWRATDDRPEIERETITRLSALDWQIEPLFRPTPFASAEGRITRHRNVMGVSAKLRQP
jgi:FkbM family methyltransferase